MPNKKRKHKYKVLTDKDTWAYYKDLNVAISVRDRAICRGINSYIYEWVENKWKLCM